MIHEIDGEFTISSNHVWRPGVYLDRKTANYAFRFKDETLQRLQDSVNPNGVITYEMLKSLNLL